MLFLLEGICAMVAAFHERGPYTRSCDVCGGIFSLSTSALKGSC